jgi:hypothetical protein
LKLGQRLEEGWAELGIKEREILEKALGTGLVEGRSYFDRDRECMREQVLSYNRGAARHRSE